MFLEINFGKRRIRCRTTVFIISFWIMRKSLNAFRSIGSISQETDLDILKHNPKPTLTALTPIWGFWERQGASFLDKKSNTNYWIQIWPHSRFFVRKWRLINSKNQNFGNWSGFFVQNSRIGVEHNKSSFSSCKCLLPTLSIRQF